MDNLLVEIGAEEIPAGYIAPALEAITANLLKKLSAARIEHGGAHTFGTPRRLAVMVEQVAAKQPTISKDVQGPPEKVAFDADGNPTVPAVKFAEKVGVPVTSLKLKETEKGRYLSARVTERGLATKTLLQRMLPEVILATPFPKTMKWATLDIQFARPVHSVVALLGKQIVPFKLDNIKSGRHSYGHSFMHPGKVKIEHPDGYLDALRGVEVIADIGERRQMVLQEIERAASAVGGNILPDEELVDIVTNLVEFPVATAGKFDDDFLAIPREILITAMREHQKYFAVVDGGGKLMPYFIAVNNTRTRDLGLVATGHQRVLRARLSDAKFFYNSDVKASFGPWIEKLKGVLFQAKLGSMQEKVGRVKMLAAYLADQAGKDAGFRSRVTRAAELCKADLVSQVVVEFPKLQGVMGRVYAGVAGEPQDVASAIEEHYRPTFSGGKLPVTDTGAILAIADKIDSICGCFSVGLIPTGASDPYALRRQGIGIVNIMQDKAFGFSLQDLIAKSLELFKSKADFDFTEIVEKVHTFIQNRMAHILVENGFSKDVVAAVTSAGAENVPQVWRRVKALEDLKGAPDFEPLAAAFKRVVNIIRKTEGGVQTRVDEDLFSHASEKDLLTAFRDVENQVSALFASGDFEEALLKIASLKDAVDAFFDGVLVMAEDLKVRNNRLALLGGIAALFGQFADFSKLA
ncbi:MAG: glycine--tRNA ligase subunit beta [Deltaproteobacteria bacterium]|nr:glycine--tRNA ligase subunit beta [Deltaproteobacteria bacterium]